MSSAFQAAREWAMPTLKTSAFLEKGVLTPAEFVAAGDELVFRCPTWSWEAGDLSKQRSYLPPDKQYLITRNVPCRTRADAMEQALSFEQDNDIGDGDDWLVSHIIKEAAADDNKDNTTSIEDEFDILDEEGEVMKAPAPTEPSQIQKVQQQVEGDDYDDDDEYADMDGFEDDNVLLDDEAAAVAGTATATTMMQSSGAAENNNHDDVFVKVRTYDLSITYDKYYQTPRVWMVGKSEHGQPLSGKEMMQDVIADYANKTVTIEGHPHVSGPHASIHPCQHAKVMKTIVKNLIKTSSSSSSSSSPGQGEEDKQGPSVEMYIFIFLKFVSSIIPTISYDFTMDVTADTSK